MEQMDFEYCPDSDKCVTLAQDIVDATLVTILSQKGMEREHAATFVSGIRQENKIKFQKSIEKSELKAKAENIDPNLNVANETNLLKEKVAKVEKKIKGKVVKTVKVTKPLPLTQADRLTDANTVSKIKALEEKVKKVILIEINSEKRQYLSETI